MNLNNRIEVELEAEVYMHDEGNGDKYPYIKLYDIEQNALLGHCTYLSVEGLAREYQKDKEYRNKEKYTYWLRYKGNKGRIQLFQKFIQNGYGEDPTVIDETNKI